MPEAPQHGITASSQNQGKPTPKQVASQGHATHEQNFLWALHSQTPLRIPVADPTILALLKHSSPTSVFPAISSSNGFIIGFCKGHKIQPNPSSNNFDVSNASIHAKQRKQGANQGRWWLMLHLSSCGCPCWFGICIFGGDTQAKMVCGARLARRGSPCGSAQPRAVAQWSAGNWRWHPNFSRKTWIRAYLKSSQCLQKAGCETSALSNGIWQMKERTFVSLKNKAMKLQLYATSKGVLWRHHLGAILTRWSLERCEEASWWKTFILLLHLVVFSSSEVRRKRPFYFFAAIDVLM